MLTPTQAFRIGFLMKCAADGLTPEETRDRIEKAAEFLEKGAGPLGDIGSGLASLGSSAKTYGIALPVGAGVLGGYMAHKAVDDDLDEDDVRKREIIEELQHWTRRAKEQQKMKQLRPAV